MRDVDSYGQPYRKGFKRHELCRCSPPCVRTFQCRSPLHVGRRSTPWCCGADDPGHEEHCDECWVKHEAQVALMREAPMRRRVPTPMRTVFR
jgi:hypothetical protein